MSLGTIAGTRMWGCGALLAGMFGSYATTERFAHWPIIPRGASRIGQSSHGVALRQSSLDSIDNAFAHMLERMFNSTSCVGINRGDTTRGHPAGLRPLGWPLVVSPWLIPSHSVRIFTCALASLMHYLNARPPPNAHPKIQ